MNKGKNHDGRVNGAKKTDQTGESDQKDSRPPQRAGRREGAAPSRQARPQPKDGSERATTPLSRGGEGADHATRGGAGKRRRGKARKKGPKGERESEKRKELEDQKLMLKIKEPN